VLPSVVPAIRVCGAEEDTSVERMGTFAKRLRQLQGMYQRGRRAVVFESESRNIMRTTAANKLPGSLSLALDDTLKQGHDLRTFGLGTLASMASRGRYARLTASMHAIYSAMEDELDRVTCKSSLAVHMMWSEHGDILRRSSSLKLDLEDVAEELPRSARKSPATEEYVAGIKRAGEADRSTGGARLLGHVYCRYFADLFGGQMLAMPYRLAVSLPAGAPRHFSFALPPLEADGTNGGRRALIEEVYQNLNRSGTLLTSEAHDAVIAEAVQAFQYNIKLFGEEPMCVDAVRGTLNICTGYAGSKLRCW